MGPRAKPRLLRGGVSFCAPAELPRSRCASAMEGQRGGPQRHLGTGAPAPERARSAPRRRHGYAATVAWRGGAKARKKAPEGLLGGLSSAMERRSLTGGEIRAARSRDDASRRRPSGRWWPARRLRPRRSRWRRRRPRWWRTSRPSRRRSPRHRRPCRQR